MFGGTIAIGDETLETISYSGAAHRNGCLQVDSVYSSVYKEVKLGHPQSMTNLSSLNSLIVFTYIIRCKVKWHDEGQRCWAIKYVDCKNQQRQFNHFTYNIIYRISLYLLFVLWFLLWCLWFSAGRRFSLCQMLRLAWRWMPIIWRDSPLECTMRNVILLHDLEGNCSV